MCWLPRALISFMASSQMLNYPAQWQSRRMAKSLRDSKPEFYRLTDSNRKIINQRYVDFQLPAPGSILAISSPMETGKTVAGGKLRDEFYQCHSRRPTRATGLSQRVRTADSGQVEHGIISASLEASAPGISQMLIDDAQSLAYCLDSLNRRARAINDAIAEGRKGLRL